MRRLMASDGTKGVVIISKVSFIHCFFHLPFFFNAVIVQVHLCVLFKISHFLTIIFKNITGENYDFYKTVIFTDIFFYY